jgi:hypothetical protein
VSGTHAKQKTGVAFSPSVALALPRDALHGDLLALGKRRQAWDFAQQITTSLEQTAAGLDGGARPARSEVRTGRPQTPDVARPSWSAQSVTQSCVSPQRQDSNSRKLSFKPNEVTKVRPEKTRRSDEHRGGVNQPREWQCLVLLDLRPQPVGCCGGPIGRPSLVEGRL